MSEQKPLGFADLRILLAEDDAFARRLTVSTLKRIGVVHITEATDGLQALKAIAAAKTPFDLIVSDWNMPNMTGLDLLRLVRDEHPAMPFLMLTGNAGIDMVKTARTHKVDAYVVKPFSTDQLRSKIAAILNIRTA